MLGLFALSAVIAVIWVAVERRVAEPLIEIPMLTHRGTLGATGSGLILGFTLFLSMTTMSGFAQSQGSTTLQVGVYLLPTTMLMLVISLFAGRMMRRLSAPTLVATGSLVVGAADLWLLAFHRGEFDMYAATTLLGIGIGAAYAALGTMAVQHVEPAKTAVASGVNSLMRVVGGSMCGAVLAAILAAHTPAGSAVPSVTGYEVSLAVAAAGALVAALFAAGFARYARAAAPEPALADA
ncbi:MFS transporter [Thermocatellispora tengchongensis]|uniref:MFS transporter n=1 Tax=Thermocatellispora tengchongensis TaxID=1073253 RepID=UPI00362940EE